MTMKTLLTFNPGSSTAKIGLFALDDDGPVATGRGIIDFRHDPLTFKLKDDRGSSEIPLHARSREDLTGIMAEMFAALGKHATIGEVMAVGHRVVHGGDRFSGPVKLDDDVIHQIDALMPLAPLHQPQSLRFIRAIRNVRPELLQTASFDTAFHRTISPVVRHFAIPRALYDQGIKRYGFHGLSYQYLAEALTRLAPACASGKIVAAHLGSGASICGLDNGVSRDTSMSFSTLDGIPMATRCGALDPGVLLHLLKEGDGAIGKVEDMVYHRSGLLGVSGISADSRELLVSKAPEAREALDVFTLRTAGEIARLATTIGGLDGLIFSAGIGENQPEIRAGICRRLEWLGIELDPAANDENAKVISTAASRVSVFVIPTDEEAIIARESFAILNRASNG